MDSIIAIQFALVVVVTLWVHVADCFSREW